MTELIFYTTLGCHLCEQAEELLRELEQHREVTVEAVDIGNDEALVGRYGIRIPVVRNPSTAVEVGWPFSVEDLLTLV